MRAGRNKLHQHTLTHGFIHDSCARLREFEQVNVCEEGGEIQGERKSIECCLLAAVRAVRVNVMTTDKKAHDGSRAGIK